MDLTSTVRSDALPAVGSTLVPGAVAAAPYVALAWGQPHDLKLFVDGNQGLVTAAAALLVVSAGLLVESFGSYAEYYWVDRRHGNREQMQAEWAEYLGITWETEPIGQHYLRKVLTIFKFELNLFVGLLLSLPGTLFLGYYGVLPAHALLALVLGTSAAALILFKVSVDSSKLLATLRQRLLDQARKVDPLLAPSRSTQAPMTLAQEIFDNLDVWTNQLAAHTLPLQVTPDGDDAIRLEFRQKIPKTVMIGKLVRAVSGLRAALVLAEAGHVTECAAVLRIVSDLCTEISAIGFALDAGGEQPEAVRDFVEQYFKPRARTPEEFASMGRARYVSREALMKVHHSIAQARPVDADALDRVHRFLNVSYDAYVHGAYETTLELWNSREKGFEMRGHSSQQKRDEFKEAVHLKMHEVVVAIELTAARTSDAEVFALARQSRRRMDASEPWRH